MAVTQPHCWSESDQKAVLEQLERILQSVLFLHSPRRRRFLSHIVSETLAGRGERLKGYNLALEVFGRPQTFDPVADPIVRIEAARLREKLREYYETVGQSDTIRIDLPKGGYKPQIEFRQAAPVHPRPHLPASTPLSEKASVAVLPFKNIGNDAKWNRFADGITEEIVTDLSQSKDLFVVARYSTEVYKWNRTNVIDAGLDLDVRYVLEGSIQAAVDRIRVNARLIDTRTGTYVWSKRYDRLATDLFDVQSDVTGQIVATLTGYEGAVAEAERSLIRRKPPTNLTAYEIYLLGMQAKHTVTKEGLDEAERLFRNALVIDPHLARAYVGLAYIYEYRLQFGLGSAAYNLTKLRKAARKAVRLDPNDGETQLVLGHAFAYQGMAEQALEQFAKAEALAPSNADVLILIAWYLPQLGQPERAVMLADKAVQLNPNYPYWYNRAFCHVYFFGHQFDKSLKHAKLISEPFATDYAYLAAVSAMIGDMVGAKAAAAEVYGLDANWNVEKFLSDGGGYPENVAIVLLEAAEKAGVAACVPADKVSSIPELVHATKCDVERTRWRNSQNALAVRASE